MPSTWNMMLRNEETLWRSIRAGDSSAFNLLYDRYIDILYSFARQYVVDDELIKDTIHDVFLDIYKSRNSLDIANPKGYLLICVRNKLLRKNRKKEILQPWQEQHTTQHLTKSQEEFIIADETTFEQNKRLAFAITQLSSKQQQALYLRYNLNKEYEEIAKIMNLSVASGRTLIYRAIKELRHFFKTELLLIIGLWSYYLDYFFTLLIEEV